MYKWGVGNFGMEDVCVVMFEMFFEDVFDVVFVVNDYMVMVVMDMLWFELGFKVFEDVLVVGYDDVLIVVWFVYGLIMVC